MFRDSHLLVVAVPGSAGGGVEQPFESFHAKCVVEQISADQYAHLNTIVLEGPDQRRVGVATFHAVGARKQRRRILESVGCRTARVNVLREYRLLVQDGFIAKHLRTKRIRKVTGLGVAFARIRVGTSWVYTQRHWLASVIHVHGAFCGRAANECGGTRYRRTRQDAGG